VDYAKGICIVMVVMMHSVLGRRNGGRPDRLHASAGRVRKTVPDAGLLPDLGLFLSVVIARRLAPLISTAKGLHFAYFYLLWVTIQFGFKAPSFAAETSGPCRLPVS